MVIYVAASKSVFQSIHDYPDAFQLLIRTQCIKYFGRLQEHFSLKTYLKVF